MVPKLTSPVYIRGIGSRINEPSIGLYVDNVPYFDKAAFDFDFYDVERIEVLRGPQGTLYGRNTMGGIINIITRSPLDFTGTRFMASAGSYGQYAAGISHFANPVANFGYSLSLNYRHNDGFFTNQFNDRKVDHMDLYGFRNRLVWKVNDRLTLENV
jgi:iron complex outermembrane recepter protein